MLPLAARARALISGAALRGNLSALSFRAGAPLVLPVKGNAYGHGLEVVARLAAAHPDLWGYAVATPREAAQLAALELGKPILLLTPPLPHEVAPLADLGVRLPVASLAEAEALPAHARAHLKVDTGMRRLGARPEDAVAIGRRLRERGLLEGVYTHFATSDSPDLAFAHEQLRRFRAVQDALPGVLAHAANGAGILSLGRVPGLNLARPGLAAYGYVPAHLGHLAPLRPVMTVQARVTHLHAARAGEGVSYGAVWTATQDTRLATVGLGYADGYSRGATGQAHMLVNGESRPVRGRICMDQCMVDLGEQRVEVGDWIEAWGAGEITATHVAAWADTVEYEVLTGVGERVERVAAD